MGMLGLDRNYILKLPIEQTGQSRKNCRQNISANSLVSKVASLFNFNRQTSFATAIA